MKKTLGFCATMSMAMALSAVLSITSIASDMKQTIDTDQKKDLLFGSVASTAAVQGSKPKMDLKSFKNKFIPGLTELNQLRLECSYLWSKIKTSNDSIKANWKAFKADLASKDKKEKKNILADMKAKIEPIRIKVKTLNSEIKTLNNQKAAEWVNFKSAVKTRYESKASIALNNIISLKKQVIEKQKSLLELKKEILSITDYIIYGRQ